MPSKKTPKVKKTFALEWLLEPLQDDESFLTRRMFGGLAVYFNGLLVLMLTESPGDRIWQGIRYDFDIWNGVLFPTSREHHGKILHDWPTLVPHPVLPKWLYAPMNQNLFEENVSGIVSAIKTGDARFGIEPGQKKKATTGPRPAQPEAARDNMSEAVVVAVVKKRRKKG